MSNHDDDKRASKKQWNNIDKCSFIILLVHPFIYSIPLITDACHKFIISQKSSFNTYTTPMAPYVSIVPTSSNATATGLLIRPPQSIAIGGPPPPSSILIGSGGLNNNPSILAQSPSNLGKIFAKFYFVYSQCALNNIRGVVNKILYDLKFSSFFIAMGFNEKNG